MRIESFKVVLSTILIFVSTVALVMFLSISLVAIGTAENYMKGNNIAGGSTSTYGNMTINQGCEKDGDLWSYLQGGYSAPQNQWVILNLGSYKSIYSVYWKFGRTFYGYVSRPCYLYVHETDGWHTIDTKNVDPNEWFQNELELNGQLVDQVEFYGDSIYDSGQFAQWMVYEIEIFEALPWPPIIVSISPSSQVGDPGENISYTVTVKNLGTSNDSYDLTANDNDNWGPTLDDNRFDNVGPGENRVTTLRATIPGIVIPGTVDNMIITATSRTDNTASTSASCTAEVALRIVNIIISPISQNGVDNATLVYTVTVTNTGNVLDNYSFVAIDNAVPSWSPSISPTFLVVAPFNSENAILSVNIPSGAVVGTIDNIRVTATSRADNTVSGNASCIASVVPGVPVILSVGWNLVEFTAVDNTKDTPTNVFPGMTYLSDFVIFWYKVGAGYQLQGASTPFNDNTAYWVHIKTTKTVRTSGTRPITRSVILTAGWNMVGFPVVNENTTSANVFPGLSYLSDYVIFWNKMGAGYQLQVVSSPFMDNTGYWVWINATKIVTVP